MKAKIISVHNHGDVSQEYVLIQAQEDCDTVRLVLADSTYTASGKVSNKLRHTYWLPSKQVSKGDYIVVFTGKGKSASSEDKYGVPVHRFYWGLETAVWNDDGDCAVLQELVTWQFFKASE